MLSNSVVIKNSKDEFSINICFSGGKKNLLLHARTISGSSELLQYTYDSGTKCEGCAKDFIYSPLIIQNIFDALKKKKLYGIIDVLPCGGGHSVTLLTRCNRNHIEISYPILFIKTCQKDHCMNSNRVKGFKRYAVNFLSSPMYPVSVFRRASCEPPN